MNLPPTDRRRVLDALKEGTMTSGEVSLLTGIGLRSCSAMLQHFHKAKRIDRSPLPVRRGTQRGAYLYSLKVKKPWTTGEIALLVASVGKRPMTVARHLPGRSTQSIINQALRYGVKLKVRVLAKWTPHHGVKAAQLVAEGKTLVEVAKLLNIPYSTLRLWFK